MAYSEEKRYFGAGDRRLTSIRPMAYSARRVGCPTGEYLVCERKNVDRTAGKVFMLTDHR